MDSLSGIAANLVPHHRSTVNSAERSAPAFASPNMAGRSTASPEAAAGPPVRPSLLIALQEVRLNKSSGEESEDGEAAARPCGLFCVEAEAENGGESVIDEIKEKGLTEWAHEQWLERIREKARQAALADLGLTEDDVAAMGPEMQAQIERLIQEAVDEAVRRAIEKAAGGDETETENRAMVLNPIVTGG